jgi:hypothetical protein
VLEPVLGPPPPPWLVAGLQQSLRLNNTQQFEAVLNQKVLKGRITGLVWVEIDLVMSSLQRLNLYWGLIPFRLDFSEDMEMNLQRTFALLLKRGMMKSGEVVIVVSDISQVKEADLMQSIQIRKLPSLDSLK